MSGEMNKKVSIIIPHFNRIDLLKQTIASIQAQTYANWECIIVDDCSDDLQWQEVKRLQSSNIKVFQREDGKKGPSTCRNLGVNEACGELLIFFDSDDLMKPFCLEQRLHVMASYKKLDGAIFKMSLFNLVPADNECFFNIDVPMEDSLAFFLKNENPWQTSCPVWKRSAFLRVGGFDEELFYMEDPELHIRALYQGLHFQTFYDFPADTYYRINHFDETKSSFYYNSIYYRILFYEKIIADYPMDFKTKHKNDIKSGIYQLIKTFLYSRKNKYPELYKWLFQLMNESGLFSNVELKRIHVLVNVGNTKNVVLQRMKLRGLCFKLLPKA